MCLGPSLLQFQTYLTNKTSFSFSPLISSWLDNWFLNSIVGEYVYEAAWNERRGTSSKREQLRREEFFAYLSSTPAVRFEVTSQHHFPKTLNCKELWITLATCVDRFFSLLSLPGSHLIILHFDTQIKATACSINPTFWNRHQHGPGRIRSCQVIEPQNRINLKRV